MKRFFTIAILAIVAVLGLSSCGVQKNAQSNLLNSLQVTTRRAPQHNFYDLKTGVQIKVVTTPTEEMTGYVHHLSGKNIFTTPTVNYVQSMAFREISPDTDYKLFITIKRADVDGWNGKSYMDMEVYLKDDQGKEVFSQGNISTTAQDMMYIPNGLLEAYTQALERVDWNRIASYLREENKANKKGQSHVASELQQTIIRWDVQSRPQGADIFWRVVSKTPEVKSTNNKYLQTTPYEATKALDIKGLTYENSSNVRIILRCEKDGYLSQEKEYDVRMIMDQEEISAFFRLVKEE